MAFGNKSQWTFVSIAAKSITRLAVNKIFAIYLGATGIALLAHFQNLIGIMTQLPNDGVNRGLSHLLMFRNEKSEIKKLTGSAFIFNIVLFTAAGVILLVFQDYFFKYFILSLDDRNFYMIFFAAVFVFIVNLFLQAFILSLKNAVIYAVSNILGVVLLLGLVFIGARTRIIDYALLAFCIGQALNVLATISIIARYRSAGAFSFRFSLKAFKKMSQFLLMVFSALVFSKLVDYGVRQFAIDAFGFRMTGLWQSVVKISDSYMSLFISTVGVVYYPQVSALIFDTDQLRKYINDVLYIVIPVTGVGLILIYIFREPVLHILFSREFVPAQHLIRFQLVGDFFGIISYLLIYIVSAQARTLTFILLQFGSAALYLGLIFLLVDDMGIETFPLAHAFRFVIFFSVLVILNRRILF